MSLRDQVKDQMYENNKFRDENDILAIIIMIFLPKLNRSMKLYKLYNKDLKTLN